MYQQQVRTSKTLTKRADMDDYNEDEERAIAQEDWVNFVFQIMNFLLTMMNLVFKMMDSVLNTVDFAF